MWKKIKLLKNKGNTKRDIKEISFEDIKKDNYILVDVRARKEYIEGHLNGAINIPLFDIKKKCNNLKKKDKIIVYCQSGIRSRKAIKILENLGFENVYNLKGGLDNI